ncbi:MAG: hypothetical protein IJR55_04715 [Clostridia bacterium]|nr:hypothetical protein [Clostridia bacterium]
MGKGFGFLAAVAAAVLLTPYNVEIDKENNTYKFRSLLLNVNVKKEKDEETNETTHNVEVKLAGKPTKEDFETLKTNVANVANEGVKKAKETVEKAKDFANKAKEKFTEAAEEGEEECCCGGDEECCCGEETAEQAETAETTEKTEDVGDFCTEEEAAQF